MLDSIFQPLDRLSHLHRQVADQNRRGVQRHFEAKASSYVWWRDQPHAVHRNSQRAGDARTKNRRTLKVSVNGDAVVARMVLGQDAVALHRRGTEAMEVEFFLYDPVGFGKGPVHIPVTEAPFP